MPPEVPPELIELILSFLPPSAYPSVAQVSKALAAWVRRANCQDLWFDTNFYLHEGLQEQYETISQDILNHVQTIHFVPDRSNIARFHPRRRSRLWTADVLSEFVPTQNLVEASALSLSRRFANRMPRIDSVEVAIPEEVTPYPRPHYNLHPFHYPTVISIVASTMISASEKLTKLHITLSFALLHTVLCYPNSKDSSIHLPMLRDLSLSLYPSFGSYDSPSDSFRSVAKKTALPFLRRHRSIISSFVFRFQCTAFDYTPLLQGVSLPVRRCDLPLFNVEHGELLRFIGSCSTSLSSLTLHSQKPRYEDLSSFFGRLENTFSMPDLTSLSLVSHWENYRLDLFNMNDSTFNFIAMHAFALTHLSMPQLVLSEISFVRLIGALGGAGRLVSLRVDVQCFLPGFFGLASFSLPKLQEWVVFASWLADETKEDYLLVAEPFQKYWEHLFIDAVSKLDPFKEWSLQNLELRNAQGTLPTDECYRAVATILPKLVTLNDRPRNSWIG